jgi:hypothetical protein
MTEIVLRKRAGRQGEVGLFVESPVFETEWQSIKVGAEVVAECSVPETAKYRKFFHALCGLLADNCDWLVDKDDAKEKLLLECRHVTYHHDKLRNRAEIRAKTTKNLSSDEWIRLLKRASYAVTTKFIPGMPENDLTKEIERMING